MARAAQRDENTTFDQTSGAQNQVWAPAKRQSLFGVPLWSVNRYEGAQIVIERAKKRESGFVGVANVYTVMMAHHDKAFCDVYKKAKFVVPDGMPLVWALNSLGLAKPRLTSRVFGPDLMLDVMDLGRADGLRHYLYGGTEGTAKTIEAKLTQRFPGLKIVGTYEPPFRPLTAEEKADAIHNINATNPHILWVGIGAPKQENLMADWENEISCVALGVGAAFDFHSGRVRRGPEWMSSAGLEWMFRLAMEPRRLWRRYFWANPRFLLLWAFSMIKSRR